MAVGHNAARLAHGANDGILDDHMGVRAAVCRAFGAPLVIEEVELAAPEAGEVAVRLAACAICHSDIHFAEGAWGGVLPAVYGHEAAGVVYAVGAGVDATWRPATTSS